MSAAAQQKPQLMVKLSVVKGPHAGQVFQLDKDLISIGRGPENDIVLLNDPQVSRLHAQLVLVDRDFEIVNLSRKNAVFVNGENVDRWKLVNHENFIIGDSEFKIEFDLGLAVASVPRKKLESVKPSQPAVVAKAVVSGVGSQNQLVKKTSPPNSAVASRPANMPAAKGPRPLAQLQAQKQAPPHMKAAKPSPSLVQSPRFRFYAIVAVLLGAFLFFVLMPGKVSSTKAKPLLKYEDEIAIKLNSTSQKERLERSSELLKTKNSPQMQRADENFIKGMRDFQLGNYARAIDFYQVVLNLQPDHALARRHLYLSKVRFDELVQAKLVLGESYYKKHNFNMCESMYQQVKDMLGEKKINDPKYQLAESKAKECRLAAEGIR